MTQEQQASSPIIAESHPSRLAIVQSALKLFQSQGYSATGVTAILADVGLPKGSFYHHFPGGKEEVALATLEWLRGEIVGWMDAKIEAGAGFDELALGLAGIAAKSLAFAGHMQGSLITVLASEAVPRSAAITAALDELIEVMAGRLAAQLSERSLHPAFADGFAVLAFVQGATTIARIRNDPDLIKTMMKAYLLAR